MKRRSLAVLLFVGVAISGCGQDVATNSVASGDAPLCISYYKQCINPIFSKTFVTSSGSVQCINCHAGGPGKSFQIMTAPVTDLDWLGNYESARQQALEGANSRLLIRPSGINHGIGPKVFAGTSDADYQRILYWLQNPVDDRGDIDPAKDTVQCKAVFSANPC